MSIATERVPVHKLKTARDLYSRGGWIAVAAESLWQVAGRWTNVVHVFTFDLDHPTPQPTLPPGFSVTLYRGLQDRRKFVGHLLPLALTEAEIDRRLGDGDIVAIGSMAGDFVGYTWMKLTGSIEINECGRFLCADPEEALQYDTFIVPKYRGRGLQFPLALPMLDYARELGLARTTSYVNALNTRSRKNQIRTGRKKVLTVVSVRLPGTRKFLVRCWGEPHHRSLVRTEPISGQVLVSSLP
jgi:GNAT superfamily N-acetyltransferase